MPVLKTKNRRYRNSKISEYRLRRLVECFAREMTAKEAAAATKLSPQAINGIFMRLRERMLNHGLVKMQPHPNEPPAAQMVFDRKHRGVPEKYHDLYEAEFIHRVLTAQQFKGFEKLSASNPAHVEKARRVQASNRGRLRYNVIEAMKPGPNEVTRRTRRFDPLGYDETSDILINEIQLDRHTAFFRYLWDLLLRVPL